MPYSGGGCLYLSFYFFKFYQYCFILLLLYNKKNWAVYAKKGVECKFKLLIKTDNYITTGHVTQGAELYQAEK